MPTVGEIVTYLDQLAARHLAEDWDNTGLLLGDRNRPALKVMTCLTATQAVVEEACDEQVNLLISHHPLPFRPLKIITAESHSSKKVWQLASQGVSLYSPHTRWDSASGGINQQWAEGLDLWNIEPLLPTEEPDPAGGTGRQGTFAQPLSLLEVCHKVKSFLDFVGLFTPLRVVGENEKLIERVGIGCGGADSFLGDAIKAKCDLFITGEARFHNCLEAEEREIGFILTGHYASERFAYDRLAKQLSEKFADCEVWSSRREGNPWNLYSG
ncbi:GTP cyclohydrolase 1 type 2 [Planctomycetales bacterium 10988]|nr:GTP cyclohydrolase 1 type 2 [Planctomycetales bacterium 10988]